MAVLPDTARRPPARQTHDAGRLVIQGRAAAAEEAVMSNEIEWTASPRAEAVLAALGRTEDVAFSPSHRRLAVAGFHADRIAVFAIAIDRTAGAGKVTLGEVVEIHAPTLRKPHGVSFIDEGTVAVANRNGSVQVFAVPSPCVGPPPAAWPTLTIVGGPASPVHTPGSVSAFALDDDTLELLVCNNYANTVTQHLLDRRNGLAITSERILLQRGLDVPDGICVSPDGRWIAVSNHNTQSVLVYERTPALNAGSRHDGILRNVLCPHGLRFTADGQHLLVADAAARFVNVYRRDGSSWHGTRDPVRLFPVLDEATFARGRHNPQEGGPKGIDVDADMGVLVATCESQTLAFFDLSVVLSEALDKRDAPENRHKRYVQWRLANAAFKRLGYLRGRRRAAPTGGRRPSRPEVA